MFCDRVEQGTAALLFMNSSTNVVLVQPFDKKGHGITLSLHCVTSFLSLLPPNSDHTKIVWSQILFTINCL